MDKTELLLLTKEYLKSYYSINSYIWCTINCWYCLLAPLGIVPNKPVKPLNEEDLINQVLESPYFIKDKTILSINSRTDPFLNEEVKDSTFKLLDLMETKWLKNFVTITTKCLISKEDAKRLNNYKNLKIIIIVTYNWIPFNIQPISQDNQENTMKNISKCSNLRLLHQFRPIMPWVNDDEHTIRKIISFAKKYCMATIYQWVRVNECIKSRLTSREYNYKWELLGTHKRKNKNTDEMFDKIRKKNPNYPIFDHTSCCLSYFMGRSDYNMHYTKRECSAICPNYNLCHWKVCAIKSEDLDWELKKIWVHSDWNIENGLLIIEWSLNDEQKSYIKHILNLNVTSKVRIMNFSDNIIK